MNNEHWKPRLAIAALIGSIALYDYFCPKGETISEEAYRLRSTKIGRFIVDKLLDDVVEHLRGEQNWINGIAKLSPKENGV